MKVLSENLKEVVNPLESVTINLSPEELEIISMVIGYTAVSPYSHMVQNLYDKLSELCKKYNLNKVRRTSGVVNLTIEK
jgi:hypothetical protein